MKERDDVTIRDVYDLISEFRSEVAKKYVTKDEFDPVKMIAYGLVGIILVSVMGAFLVIVVRNPQEIHSITNSIP